MTTLAVIQQTHPEAWVHFDQTAQDCGFPRPWFVWSTQDDDMKCLGEGKTEVEALANAVQEVGE